MVVSIVLLLLIPYGFQSGVAEAGEPITVSGLTEPLHDVQLSFEIDGKISKIYFREGASIEKGATIIVLNKWLEELEVKRNRLI